MDTAPPLTVATITDAVQNAFNLLFAGIADEPRGGTFELTAPTTGQRFRVTVAEVPGWSGQMDDELTALFARGEVT